MFLKATTAEKKLIVTTLTKSIKFDGENVIVEMKDTFKALQNVKKTYKNNVRNSKVRTPANSSIITKNGSQQAEFENGARSGLLTDPLLNQLKNITQTAECQYCLYNLSKLAA